MDSDTAAVHPIATTIKSGNVAQLAPWGSKFGENYQPGCSSPNIVQTVLESLLSPSILPIRMFASFSYHPQNLSLQPGPAQGPPKRAAEDGLGPT